MDVRTNSKQIGDRIRTIRKEKKLTQKKLADEIGKKEITVRKYESGAIEFSLAILQKIAKALDVSVDELLTGITEYDKNKISDNAHNFYSSPLLNKAINNISSKIRIEHWDDKIYLWLNGKHEISPQMEQKVVSLLESNIDNLLESLTLLLKEGE